MFKIKDVVNNNKCCVLMKKDRLCFDITKYAEFCYNKKITLNFDTIENVMQFFDMKKFNKVTPPPESLTVIGF